MQAENGFSLLEMLVGLTLGSLVLLLGLQSLNHLALFSARTIPKIDAEDNAVSALLLLQKQLDTARIRECPVGPLQIESGLEALHPELHYLDAYRVLELDDPVVTAWKLHNSRTHKGNPLAKPLLLYHLSDTFYVNTLISNQIKTTKGFGGKVGDLVVVDDCEHALLTNITSVLVVRGHTNTIRLQGFHATDFHLPFSVSLLSSKMYYLGQTQNVASSAALFRSNRDKREEILPEIQMLEFTQNLHTLSIQVQPEMSQEVYRVEH